MAAQEAGERRREVYMGIDVFGRGTYAGGQLNSYVAAAAAIRKGSHIEFHLYQNEARGSVCRRSTWQIAPLIV